ncbi:cytochrome P450 [Xylariaceae sp. FL0804]|nr:cytochrome P450 [Xylariaceae sp. FL0804]
MSFPITLILVTVLAVYAILRRLENRSQSREEPPLVENGIPFLSPILQMMRHGTSFYVRMRTKHNLPIYTLRVPGSRLYVVNSVPLISAVQKQYTIINWAPLMSHAISWISGTGEAVNNAMMRDILEEDGFLQGANKVSFPFLAPGPSLDSMNRLAIQAFARRFDALVDGGAQQLSLLSWVRSQIVVATTDAIYGPHNPFRDPSVEDAWNVYEPGIPNLGPKALPSFLESKSTRAREHVVKAIREYFQHGFHTKGSPMVNARYNYFVKKYEMTDVTELARLELAGAFASIENTVNTTFWFMYRVFSNSDVLAECTMELSTLVQERDGRFTVDVDAIKEACPILQSTLHESMRYHSATISARRVIEDYRLDSYLLKKGSTLLIPATVPHSDPSTWGASCDSFDHHRFSQKSNETAGKSSKRMAFRGFGGGHHLCPGRHFAVTEMLGLVAMTILRFQLTPKGGKWDSIQIDKLSFNGTAAPVPASEFTVLFQPKPHQEWHFLVSGTGKRIELLNNEL